MSMQPQLGDIVAEVTRKDIKNVHLSVHPPGGSVRISAPKRMKQESIMVFALSKLRWIKRQQVKLASQHRETPRDCSDRESHFLWGERYLLAVSERNQRPEVEVTGNRIALWIGPNTDKVKRVLSDLRARVERGPDLALPTPALRVEVAWFLAPPRSEIGAEP